MPRTLGAIGTGILKKLVFLVALATAMSVNAWPQLGPDGVASLQMPVADLAYSKLTDKVYVCVPGTGGVLANTLAEVNPLTGDVEQSIPVGSSPSKVVASEDGEYLYVVAGGGNRIEQINAASGVVEHSFTMGNSPPGPFSGAYQVQDIAVMPGQPTTIAVACFDGQFGYTVRIYDDGVQRSQAVTNRVMGLGPRITTLDFGANSSVLYGLETGTTPQTFHTLSVTSEGVSEEAALSNAPFDRNADFTFADNRIFTTSSSVFDPKTYVMHFPFSGGGGSCAVDAAKRRIAYIAGKSSYFENYQVRVFSLDTCLPIGTISLASPPGYPTTKLIRWGADGLALMANTNQIYFMRTWMLPSAPPADLSVAEQFTPGATSNALLQCSITNAGPNAAQDVRLTVSFKGTVGLSTVTTTAGTFQITNNQVTCDIGTQQTNSTDSVQIRFSQTLAGTVVAYARVTSSSFDSDTGNNTSIQVISTPARTSAGQVYSLTLPIAGMVADPVRGGIFLAVDRQVPDIGNGVMYFDPTTGAFSSSAWVGTNIQRLAISSDGQTLYAGSAGKITMLDAGSLTVLTNYPLVNDDTSARLAVFPDDSRRVAVLQQTQPDRLGNTSPDGLDIYEDGVLIGSTNANYSTLAPAASGSTIRAFANPYTGFTATSFTVSNGTVTNDSSLIEPMLSLPGELRCENDCVFSGSGRVYDLATRRLRGTFNVPGIDGWPNSSSGTPLVEPDLANGRVYFIRYDWPEGVKLFAFDAARFRLLGSMLLPGVLTPDMLIRWGADGFAFRSDKLFIVRTSLVPNGPEADLGLSLYGGANPGAVSQSESYAVTITNAGPESASNVVASVSSSLSGTITDMAPSQGSASFTNLTLAWDVGSVSAGQTASIHFNYTPGSTGFLTMSASVAASCKDRDASNNTDAHSEIVTNGTWADGAPLSIPVTAVTSDPSQTELFLTLHAFGGVSGNSIMKLNPKSAVISGPVYIGSNPSQLAVSRYGSRLYVGLDGASAVEEVSTASLKPIDSFSISNGLAVGQIASLPGITGGLLIYRNLVGVSLFENGIEIGNPVNFINTFVYDDSTGFAFGCDRNHSGVPLYRLTINSNGIAAEALSSSLQQSGSDLKAAQGRLFYDRGLVVSTATATEAERFPADKFVSRVQPALDRGLVYFLTSDYGPRHWSLRAFRSDSGAPAGMTALPGVFGTPGPLCRWGNTGLAFATSTNQLCLLHDEFTSDSPAVDLAIFSLSAPKTARINTLATYTCTITNRSDTAAVATIATQAFDLVGDIQTVQVSTGTAQTDGTSILWTVGDLPPHASASMSLSLLPTAAQTMSSRITATSLSYDPSPDNNTAQTYTPVRNLTTNATVSVWPTTFAGDLVYDPDSRLLWASMTNGPDGGEVVPINPVQGTVGPGIDLHSEVTRLGVSCNGAYLYCLLPKAAGVARINLASRQVDQFTSVGYNPVWGFHTPADLAASPTNPARVAVSYSSAVSSSSNFVALIDDGVLQPSVGISQSPSTVIEFDAAADQLYGFDSYSFSTFNLTTNGLMLATNRFNFRMGADVKRGGSLLFGASGLVLDPRSALSITNLPGSSWTAVEPVAGENRVYYATRSPYTIRTYNLTNFTLAGTCSIPGISSDLRTLVRWGVDGLAMTTAAGQVVIVGSSIVPVPPLQDTDGDGIPDDWEVRYGLNPYDNSDANLDIDGNGLTCLEEYLNGLDPYAGANPLRLERVAFQDGHLTVVFRSLAGRRHAIEFSDTLAPPHWTTVTNGILGSGGDLTNQLSSPPGTASGYFRVLAEP